MTLTSKRQGLTKRRAMVPEFLENDRLRLFEYGLRQDAPDDRIDYTRVLSGVFDRITGAEIEGPLSIVKLDEVASGTLLQNVEDGVARRIAEYLEFDEPIDECITGDRKVPDLYWNALERRISQKIDKIVPFSVEEQIIKTDEILDQGKAEAVEKALFQRIGNYEAEHIIEAPARRAFFRFERIVPIAASVLLVLTAVAGYFIYRDSQTLPLVLYQAQGTNLDAYKRPISSQGLVQSEKGGSLTIVNKKGFVELRNGSKLEIVKASDREVLYRAKFAGADNQLVGQGSATFFVNRQKKNQKYVVATHDYRVEVTGTYFRLQPDIDGHVSVAVREGEVKIIFNAGDVKVLKAGQVLAYDLNSNTFNTVNDGISIPRQEIEQLPDMKELDDYCRVSVNSSPSAGVRLDGRYVGSTPLIIMQPQGLHFISLEKNGYQKIDTTIQLDKTGPGVFSFNLMGTSDAQAIVFKNIHVSRGRAIVDQRKSSKQTIEAKPEKSEQGDRPAGYNESDFRVAENLESKNWQKASELYRAVFENPRTPKLKKEAALFSMAKLEAEHAADKKNGKEMFLHYLALYPTGNFVGESLLRLAELEFEHDQNKSIEYYRRYFEKYPRNSRISELQYRVGLIYLQKKKFDEAISMFKLSLANFQGNDAVEKEKIKTTLFKAFKEKNESQTSASANADGTSR
jgi:TolA-binding protein